MTSILWKDAAWSEQPRALKAASLGRFHRPQRSDEADELRLGQT